MNYGDGCGCQYLGGPSRSSTASRNEHHIEATKERGRTILIPSQWSIVRTFCDEPGSFARD
jgi:hypothetical protein